jgi:hypothetical protein
MKKTVALGIPLLFSAIMGLTTPAVLAADSVPKTTPEGMTLVKQTDSRLVYVMPGASLEPYSKVALLDCYVAFRKNWERDYNRDAAFGVRVSDSDMTRITKELAEEFKAVFSKELTDGGYEIVDHTGPDVVVIRPAIINLDVTAPDLRSASMTTTIARSAGNMTLYMELFDSVSSAVFARVMDAESADRGGFAGMANKVTNKAEADRVIRAWAKEMVEHLDVAKATAASR